MIETEGAIWDEEFDGDDSIWRVVPTVGYCAKDHRAVLSLIDADGTPLEGIAKEAQERYEDLRQVVGKRLYEASDRPMVLKHPEYQIITFPTHSSFFDSRPDLGIILRSAKELKKILGDDEFAVMPRVGVEGEDPLAWEVVEPHLSRLLDDNVIVVNDQ